MYPGMHGNNAANDTLDFSRRTIYAIKDDQWSNESTMSNHEKNYVWIDSDE
jgi:hypothetical protein